MANSKKIVYRENKNEQQITYIIKQINNVSQTDRDTVCRIVAFRGYELRQSNNGAYIHVHKIDENTLNEI